MKTNKSLDNISPLKQTETVGLIERCPVWTEQVFGLPGLGRRIKSRLTIRLFRQPCNPLFLFFIVMSSYLKKINFCR